MHEDRPEVPMTNPQERGSDPDATRQGGWTPGTAFGHSSIEPNLSAAGARVLIAEDDADQRKMMADRLRRDGFSVFEVGSGDRVLSEMLQLTADCWPHGGVDLLVLDLWLPGTAGLQVLGELRSGGWTLPVLLMTGHPNPTVVADAERFGVPLLRKPFSLNTLSEAAISTLLRRPVPLETAHLAEDVS